MENNKLEEKDSDIEEEMPDPPRKFYKKRFEAEKNRRKGDRIYREPGEGYYIRRPQSRKKSWFDEIFGR